MNYSNALKSLLQKTRNLNPQALLDGVTNFNQPQPEIEELAKHRSLTCVGCEYYVDEEIKLLHVNDTNLPILTGKKCGACGCILSYKLRQVQDKCVKWTD